MTTRNNLYVLMIMNIVWSEYDRMQNKNAE